MADLVGDFSGAWLDRESHGGVEFQPVEHKAQRCDGIGRQRVVRNAHRLDCLSRKKLVPLAIVAGQEFADETLKFYRTVAHADRDGTDVVLFSSSLCYLPAPAEFLDQVATSSAQYLLIDRLPVVEAPRDRIALQRVGEPIYTASYPVRLFSRQKLLADLSARWRLVETWRSELQPDSNSESHGFFLERR